MYCSKATVHNVTATVQQCTMWTARAHCKDVLYKIWDIQFIAILIFRNVRWYEMLFWYWTLNVWIGGKISCSKILIVGVVSTFDVALIISIYSVWIAQVGGCARAKCRWNSRWSVWGGRGGGGGGETEQNDSLMCNFTRAGRIIFLTSFSQFRWGSMWAGGGRK